MTSTSEWDLAEFGKQGDSSEREGPNALHAAEILTAMERAVGDFAGDLPQQDDVTGGVIRRMPG